MRTHRVARIIATVLFIAALIILILGLYAAIVVGTAGLGGGWGTGSRSWLVLPILIGTIINASILLVLGAVVYYLTAIQANLLAARKLGEQGWRPGPRPHRPISPGPASETTGASPVAEVVTTVEAVREEAVAVEEAPSLTSEATGTGEPEPATTEPTSAEEAPVEATSSATVAEPVGEKVAQEATPEGSISQPPHVEVFEEVSEATAAAEPVAAESAATEAVNDSFPQLPGTEDAARIAAEMAAISSSDEGGSQPTNGSDDFMLIRGIGPIYAQRLREAGITTFSSLASASDELLEELTDGNLERVIREDWRGQAERLND